MQTANDRLAEFRLSLGFQKKADFAEKLGIERSTYDKMEKGPHKPSADNLEKIAAKYPSVSLNWLLLGQGDMLLVEVPPTMHIAKPDVSLLADPAANYACTAPDLASSLATEVAELRAENKQLKDDLRQARKEAREDLIAQARVYNSVKQGDAELISNLYAHINRQNVKIDEYELRLGYRQPTPEEAERFRQAEAERKPISGFMGQRYSELLEAVEVEATTGGKQIFLKLAA